MAIFRHVAVVAVLFIIGTVSAKTKQQELIASVEEYIEEHLPDVNPRYKPHYHVSPPVGWMNDPNGFSFYKNEYHLFYQFYPYETAWGPMHWGHVSSTDLVEWKQLPTALAPEEEMCFSGSAVVDGDEMVLVYTGRVDAVPHPYFNETQYLAYSSDGIVFEKYVGNPVIHAAPNYAADFRDPKTWKHENYWYTIIGSKTDDERGKVLLYRSPDLKSWEFLTILAESADHYARGYMWECPDFFELDGKYVLLVSPQGMTPEGDRYKNVHQTGYFIGNFSYETFEFIPEIDFHEIDFGHDFYAAQTTDNDGKRYLVSWFSMWDVPYPEDVDGWVGQMTIIRELRIHNYTVLQIPVEAMSELRDGTIFHDDLNTGESVEFEKTGEVILNFNLSQSAVLLLEGSDGGGKAWIRWEPEVEKVVVDRGDDDVRQVEWFPIGSLSWRLFLDASSLELFCGEGEVVFSSRVYPNGTWKMTNLSPQALNVEAYHLKRSVPYYSSSPSNFQHLLSSALVLSIVTILKTLY